MERIIGIDLGTTNSLAAYVDEHTGKGECVPNRDGSNLTASAVCFLKKEAPMIGNTARDCRLLYSDRTATLFKRKMGVEKVGITVDGADYSPQQLSALVLKSLKEDAETELGGEITKAVITVPAYFDSNRRQAVIEAGQMAGFTVLDVLDEPVAAAYCADAVHNHAGKNLLIFDLGGGTLDVVAVKVTEDSIDEIAITGDTDCGGSDWDTAFVEYIRKTWLADTRLGVEAEQELANKAEIAKKALSRKTETSFTVMTDAGRREIRVTREEFESCTEAWLARAMSVLVSMRKTLQEKGVDAPDQVVLVGGASRMPQIERGIRKIFPEAKLVMKDADQAVAKGAAIYAQALMTEKQPQIRRDETVIPVKKLNRVTGRTYGIAVIVNDRDRKICNMVFQNTALPAEETDTFCTRYDNQHQVSLEVFESVTSGAYAEISEGTQIGDCMLDIRGDIPKGSPITVTIRLQENGTLFIRGEEKSGRTEVAAYMKTHALLSEEEMKSEREVIDDVYEQVG